ncbi:hypothetical protein DFP72DRAFT_893038 [Ephemerocybe angulata]|uniref:Uncharacterized protein n=1 Tax=Ephemerocybe angulata TaxID=980116 RepID=A0A8H6LRM3_9AGAR|nr:hypothetical protein DFP72DRAFT_297921 [Tulosesus angulatus]KAF6756523.1 hypothetical protein DFP72DRAFT_893038 [Tulosesus angulatus]
MRLQFIALLSTFVSLASLSSAHPEHSVDSREFVDALSTGDLLTRDLGEISTREIIRELSQRLEQRAPPARADRWCCHGCTREFSSIWGATNHENNFGLLTHPVYALGNRQKCPPPRS